MGFLCSYLIEIFRFKNDHLSGILLNPDQDNLSLRVVANFLFLRFISAGMTSPVSHGLCQQPPTPAGQKVLTKVAKILQSTANFTNSTPLRETTKSNPDIQSETAELILRLSNQPENIKLTNQNRVISLKECRRNPNRKGLHVPYES